MKENDNRDTEIIRLLRAAGPGGFVSGQFLSRTLGVSRTAVWKHVRGLKEMGFSIEAGPSKGYCLRASKGLTSSDNIDVFNSVNIAAGLETGFVGRKIFFFDNIGSTNLKAFELGREGAPEGTVVVADTQTAGRGRIGRSWTSPPGTNLYTSVILRPMIPPYEAQGLTLLAAVAVAEAVSRFIPVKPVVKWPNDVLIESKKVAGVLMEMDTEPDRVNFVVAGIGVNINMAARNLPGALKSSATSIMEKRGREVSRAAFAQGLFCSLERWYKTFLTDGLAPVIDAWRGFFTAEGKPVKVKNMGHTIEGICMGIDADGALLLRRPDGNTIRVLAGDLERVR